MENFNIYIMRCLTNMHVGSGEVNYCLIDKQVQRDVITGYPTINASSLKGSLRNFLDPEKKENNDIKGIFGSEESIGKYKFFPGMLLSIPVRSNVKTFFRATCPLIINEFLEMIKNKNSEENEDLIQQLEILKKQSLEKNILLNNEDEGTIKIEGLKIEVSKVNFSVLEKIFGEDIIVLKDEYFKQIVEDLPIIARNKLSNGKSENLWYEEVVPRETRFYFGVVDEGQYKNIFSEIEKDKVQIGGNATIGYGYCDINKL